MPDLTSPYGVLKIAPTESLVLRGTVQVNAAVFGGFVIQFADQPPKDDPVAGVAVSVTVVPSVKFPVHEACGPQLIPPAELVTVPVPNPTL